LAGGGGPFDAAPPAFGTWFSLQNTLTRSAPLILTTLRTALVGIIGGERAPLIGALCCERRSTGIAVALP
jgi:hypothetical protein